MALQLREVVITIAEEKDSRLQSLAKYNFVYGFQLKDFTSLFGN